MNARNSSSCSLPPAISWSLAVIVVALSANLAAAQSRYFTRGKSLVQGQKYEEARKEFQAGVDRNDAACMDFLGFLNLEGLGGPPQPWIAYGLFRQAAELGSDQACRNLGNMYFLARAVDADPTAAAAWWQKASGLGSCRAAFSLGQLYWLGNGIARDQPLGRKYWRRAAELGSADAEVALAAANVLEDKSTETDLKTLSKHARAGHIQAVGTLKYLELDRKKKPLVARIPFVHQAHNFCGVASSTMLLQHSGGKLSQFDFAKRREDHRWSKGSHWDELAAVAAELSQRWTIRSFPKTAAGFEDAIHELAALIAAGRPVIIDIRENPKNPGAHSILASGYDPHTRELLVVNPALRFPGFQVFSEVRLKDVWKSRGYLPNIKVERRPIMYAESN
jgi:TPR repeat protein